MNAAAAAMSGFHPTETTLHPPPDADPLGAAVARALRRDLSLRHAMNLPVVLALGLATAGLAPLPILLLRFRSLAASEKFQLEHVTEWMERRGSSSRDLDEATRRLGTGLTGFIAVGLLLNGVSLAFAGAHMIEQRDSIYALWSAYLSEEQSFLLGGFMVSLMLGYNLLWAAVSQHLMKVRRFGRALNDVLQREGSDRVLRTSRKSGTYGVWIILGVGLLFIACPWGAFMMLAAGAYRWYTKGISRDVRAEIAQRIEQMRGRDAHATQG